MRTYGSRGDPDRQRQGLHRPVQQPAGGGPLRSGLPGERHHPPADRAPVARPRPARSNASTAPCAPSSAPTGSSTTWPPPRPSSTRGSTDYNHRRPHSGDRDGAADRAVLPDRSRPARCTGQPRARGVPQRRRLGHPTRRRERVISVSGNRSASARPPPATTSTSTSPTGSSRSGTATSSSRPWPGPVEGRYARREPRSPRSSSNLTSECQAGTDTLTSSRNRSSTWRTSVL